MKIYMVSLLHRATIKNRCSLDETVRVKVRGVNPEGGKNTVYRGQDL